MASEPKRDPDERVKLPDDADATLRALLAVDPDDQLQPAGDDQEATSCPDS